MKILIRLAIATVVLIVLTAIAAPPAMKALRERNQPKWREVEVTTGTITEVVNSTGSVRPVRSVQVGAVVSGPIQELFVEFNEEVTAGQILATIDPRLFEPVVARDEATLHSREADVERVRALLQQAENNLKRAMNLRSVNDEYISDFELDQYIFNKKSLEAQLKLAEASVEQAKASLANSKANLSFTEIRSPIDGIVIDRKIDPGQSLASAFQTPELFVVAPDLRKEVHIFASVDEADIGLIIAAQGRDEPVRFTVDAYPDELFEGRIAEVRLSSTELQSVVTYPVVVSTTNPDLKLLPGMTATLSFQIQEREDVIRIPNSALRFYPKAENVHPDDKAILQGSTGDIANNEDEQSGELSAEQKAEAGRNRRRRHVWVVKDGALRAIEVVTGISDNRYSEMVSGDLEPGQKLVTGLDTEGT